ncbi:MAG: type II toxin-antitoxin system HicA family toxin [Prevotellaceae bacterium]|nr:type II toxin-antitoxin system HicA family toxin [Prevotellaceae bacterium]
MAESKGWYLERRGAKHGIYRHPDKPYQILIERHQSQEVRSGLMNKLKKLI